MRLRPYLEMTVDEYWSRVTGVYVAVELGLQDALKRTAAHINAASATNAKIVILRLNLSLICLPFPRAESSSFPLVSTGIFEYGGTITKTN